MLIYKATGSGRQASGRIIRKTCRPLFCHPKPLAPPKRLRDGAVGEGLPDA